MIARVAEATDSTLAGLTGLRVDRSSAADQVAEAVRDLIRRGDLRPGQPLPEASLASLLDMSRNTIREAFRLLSAEGLVVHQVHRGVVVRQLSESDIADIYAARRALEVAGVQGRPAPQQLDALREVVEAAEAAAARGDWGEVATANLLFHQRIVELIGSPRIDGFFAGMLAQLRLSYAAIADEAGYFGPYVGENRHLYELLATGKRRDAARELRRYLDRSEPAALEAVASQSP
jgi:DNA-binding GntR family transcriptional regulator